MDIASLGIKITQQGAEDAKAKLDALTASGAKAEAQAAKLSGAVDAQAASFRRSSDDIGRNRQIIETQLNTLIQVTNGLSSADKQATDIARGLAQALREQANAGQLTAAQMERLAAAELELSAASRAANAAASGGATVQAAAANGAQLHGLQLGRLNQELGTFIGRLTGTNTAATRLTAQVGGAVIGYGTMIAVLGGVALALEAAKVVYDKFTESSRKAAEENERLLKVLEDVAKQRSQTEVSTGNAAIAAGQARLLELQRDLANAQALATSTAPRGYAGGGLAVSYGPSADEAKAKVDEIKNQIKQQEDQITELVRKGAEERDRVITSDLAKIVASGQATATQLKSAQALLQGYQQSLTALQRTNPADTKSIVDLIDKIQELDKALNPNKKYKLPAIDHEPVDAAVLALQKELESMQKVNEENNVSALKAKQAADAVGVQGATLDLLHASQKAELDTLTALHSLSGVALTDRLQQIQATKDEEQATARAKIKIEDQASATKVMAETQKSANDVAEENIKITKRQTDATAEAIKKQIQYANDLARIWRDGLGKILTDGLKSWNDFFDDVFRLFSRLMDRMQKEGKDKGLGYTLLGIGASAAAGGSIGYGVGQTIGSAGLGAVGGAASGALAGFEIAGPLGALAGGIAGLTGGLLGGADAARKRKQAEDQLRQSLADSIESIKAQIGIIPALTAQIDQVQAQFRKLHDEADAAYAGLKNQAEREAIFKELDALEAQRIQQLKDEAAALRATTTDSLRARQLRAQGDTAAADALDRAEAEQKEILDVIKQFGVFSDVFTQLLQTLAAEDKAAADAKAKANQRAIEDAYLAADKAAASGPGGSQAARDAVDLQALILQHQREIADLEAQQASAELIAATKAKDAAEEAALAWQQAVAKIQQASNDLTQQFSVFGTNPQDQLSAIAQLYGFQGQTLQQILAQYTPVDLSNPGNITDAQRQLNQEIADYVKYYNAAQTPAGASNNTAGGPSTAPSGEKEAIRFGAQTLTEVTGNRMADYLASLVTLEREELDIQRRAFAGGSAVPFTPASSPVANLPALDKLTTSIDKLAAKADASSQPLTFQVNIKETVDLSDPNQRRQIVATVADEFDRLLLTRAKDARLRAGSTLKDV